MIPIKNENPKILVKKVKMDNDKNQKSKILKLGGLSYHPPQAGVKMGLTVCWRPTSWRPKWTICRLLNLEAFFLLPVCTMYTMTNGLLTFIIAPKGWFNTRTACLIFKVRNVGYVETVHLHIFQNSCLSDTGKHNIMSL